MPFRDRPACCQDPKKRCGTRFAALRAWVCQTTGKAVRLVELASGEQGKAPFFAQPVGYDGRTFHVAADPGCDTEKLLHDACHWLVAPRDRRGKPNFGLGPGRGLRVVDQVIADNEEVTVMLLELLLAPRFGLSPDKIAKPDYNVADRRSVDWEACAAAAAAIAQGARAPAAAAAAAASARGRGNTLEG